MSDIPTYDPATQDLLEKIYTDIDGNEIHDFEVVEKPEWRQLEYQLEQFRARLPDTVDDVNGGLVELASMSDDNTTTLADVQDALCELAELITTSTTESEV
jgi:hypothetical protein